LHHLCRAPVDIGNAEGASRAELCALLGSGAGTISVDKVGADRGTKVAIIKIPLPVRRLTQQRRRAQEQSSRRGVVVEWNKIGVMIS